MFLSSSALYLLSLLSAANDLAPNVPREHVGDGQSSDDEFLMNESSSKQDVQEDEWDNYTSGTSIFYCEWVKVAFECYVFQPKSVLRW